MTRAASPRTPFGRPVASRRRRERLAWLLGASACVVLLGLQALLLGSIVAGLSAPLPGVGRLVEALVGSLELVALACVIGGPTGLFLGLAAIEPRARGRSRVARVLLDVFDGIPPIVPGLVVGSFAGLASHAGVLGAGALALAVGIAPRVGREVCERLGGPPSDVRRAGLALGAPSWRVRWFVELRANATWLLAVTIFGASRALGEVAPLVFAASTSRWIRGTLGSPVASLPVEVFDAASGGASLSDAHAASLLLVLLTCSVAWSARRVAQGAQEGVRDGR
jgi:phosphate transport system permease protein